MKIPSLPPALLVALPLALASAACVPRWHVISQTSPDPLVGMSEFSVEPLHFEHTRVGEKTEEEYLSGKDPGQEESWRADKAGMSERFAAGLSSAASGLRLTGPGGPGPVILPTVRFIETGYYAGVSQRDTELTMRVQIMSTEGNLLDEIEIHSAISASLLNPASGTRMRQAAEDLGGVTAKYVKTRVTRAK
jgi:hypothetical protein